MKEMSSPITLLWLLTSAAVFCERTDISTAMCPTPECKCFKDRHSARCSGQKRNLTTIPKLPSYINYIWLDDYYLPTITKATFDPIRNNKIMNISMKHSQLQNIDRNTFGVLDHLASLDLESNYLTQVPDFCSMNGTSNVPHLQALYLRHNLIYSITKRSFDCLPSLRTLNLGRNNIERIPPKVFSSLTRLQYLVLAQLKLTLNGVERDAFRIPSLTRFVFNQNFYRFTYRGHTQIVGLDKCTNIEVIDLSYNHLPKWMRDAQVIFGRLLKLKVLNLRNVFWNRIPDGFFKLFPNVEQVTLSNNGITKLNHSLFPEHSQIKQLLLEANRIANIRHDTFPQQFWQRIEKLDLSANPFLCECSLLWFRDQLRISSEKFSQYPKQYMCLSPPERKGLRLSDFNMTADDCKEKSELLTVLLSSGSVCLVVVMSLSAVYKGRWHIRYWIYLLRYRRSEYRRLGDTEFRYDAFVIYADEDCDFVHDTLLPKLEGEEMYRLCVHFRDFQPGKIIADNIVESMSDSRMAIVVLSSNFCKSRWCKFELIIAQDRWLNNESDALLLVMLEDLESDHMTPDLRALIRTTTYVMWTEDSLGKRLFWDQILNTLRREN